jgi:hypothetical protein
VQWSTLAPTLQNKRGSEGENTPQSNSLLFHRAAVISDVFV